MLGRLLKRPRLIPSVAGTALVSLACAGWADEPASPTIASEPIVVSETIIADDQTCLSCEGAAEPMMMGVCDACSAKKGNVGFPVLEPFQKPGNFAAPSGKGSYFLTDAILGKKSDAPPKVPYPAFALMPPGFFNVNFKLLEDPNYDRDFTERLKRMYLTDDINVSVGGELRYRYHSEVNSRLSNQDNDFLLYRTRLFTDVNYRDLARFYIEFIDADNFGNDIAPLPFDENRADLLNLFGDFKIGEIAGKPVILRGGRQELLYGSQRLVSTLDWANNRREPFTGVKAFWHGEKLLVDAFVTQPAVFSRDSFDSIDENRIFAGLWTHYNSTETTGVDLYYLYLNDERGNALGFGGARGDANIHTLGTRYSGNKKNILFDYEGMLQFGNNVDQSLLALSMTGGIGMKFPDCPWTPFVWTYYDWASGTDSIETNSTFSTFNQLFPFGHYYMGFLDLVGRQNIHDWNTHVTVFPAKWLQLGVQHHFLRLDKSTDFLYNAGGVGIRRDPTGNAGSTVGNEFDFIANFTIDKHQSVLVGYSILLKGGFLDATDPAGEDPELTYIQYNFRW